MRSYFHGTENDPRNTYRGEHYQVPALTKVTYNCNVHVEPKRVESECQEIKFYPDGVAPVIKNVSRRDQLCRRGKERHQGHKVIHAGAKWPQPKILDRGVSSETSSQTKRQWVVHPSGTFLPAEIPNGEVGGGVEHGRCFMHCGACGGAQSGYPGQITNYRNTTEEPWGPSRNLNGKNTPYKCECGHTEFCDCGQCRHLTLTRLHPLRDYRTDDQKFEQKVYTRAATATCRRTAEGMSTVINLSGAITSVARSRRKRRKAAAREAYLDHIKTTPPTVYGGHPQCKAVELGLRPVGYECIACQNCTWCV